jgi:hypothetical protein
MGLPVLTRENVESLAEKKPEAKTAFILGTGASAARLSQEKLEIIQSQFSIGINQWIFHSLIPDLYAYEVDERLSLLKALDRPEIRSAMPPILFLRPGSRGGEDNATHVPDFLRATTYIYGRVNLWTRKVGNISRDVGGLLRIMQGRRREFLVLDDGASIVRMVALCAALGFKRVVLVGVDLNNVKYFWDEDSSYLERLGLSGFDAGQKGMVHETLSSVSRPFGVDIFIAAIAKALKKKGLVLEVESPASELAKSIPIASW